MNIQANIDPVVDKMSTWLDSFLALLPNLAVAGVVLIAFWFAARLAAKVAQKGLSRVSQNKQVVSLLSTIVRFGVAVGGIFIALGVLNLDKTVTSLLAGVGIVGLALGFAFQDIAANFVSGVLLAIRRPFQVGDLVETNDFYGTIERTDLRSTVLRRPSGQRVVIPNKDVFEKPIVNYSRCGRRRVDVEVGCGYDDALDEAKHVAMKAVEPVAAELGDGEVEVFYTGFGGSSVDMVVRFWIDDPAARAYKDAMSQAIMAIKAAFDDKGINIPYPIRTLDFGSAEPFEAMKVLARGNGSGDARQQQASAS